MAGQRAITSQLRVVGGGGRDVVLDRTTTHECLVGDYAVFSIRIGSRESSIVSSGGSLGASLVLSLSTDVLIKVLRTYLPVRRREAEHKTLPE